MRQASRFGNPFVLFADDAQLPMDQSNIQPLVPALSEQYSRPIGVPPALPLVATQVSSTTWPASLKTTRNRHP
jgi:hypothetical protein